MQKACPVCSRMFDVIGLPRHIASHRTQAKKKHVATYAVNASLDHVRDRTANFDEPKVQCVVKINGQEVVYLYDAQITRVIAEYYQHKQIIEGRKTADEIEATINVPPLKYNEH